MNGPRQPVRNQPAVPAEPGAVAVPKHPVSALATFELRDYRVTARYGSARAAGGFALQLEQAQRG